MLFRRIAVPLVAVVMLTTLAGCSSRTNGGDQEHPLGSPPAPSSLYSAIFPQISGRATLPDEVHGHIEDITIIGDVGYLVDSLGIKVLDLTDPLHPDVVSSVDIGYSGGGHKLATSGTRLYLATEKDILSNRPNDGWLRVIDISSPLRPALVGELAFQERITGLGASGDFIFALVSGAPSTLYTVDASNFSSLQIVQEFELPAGVPGLFIQGDVAFAYSGSQGLYVVDISAPQNPVLFGELAVEARDVVVKNQIAYLAGENLSQVDVSQPTQPRLIGELAGVKGNALTIAGDLLLSDDYGQGYTIIDITDPAAPYQISKFEPDFSVISTAAHGQVAYLGDEGLSTVDLSVASQPEIVDFLAPTDTGAATAIAIGGDYAFIATGPGGGLAVIDLRTEEQPRVVSLLTTTESGNLNNSYGAADIALSNGFALLADGVGGVQVISTTDPAAPEIVATLNTPGDATDIAIDGNHAYVGNFDYDSSRDSGIAGDAGLQIVDITDPESPVQLGLLHPTEIVSAVTAADDLIYLAAFEPGTPASTTRFEIVDASDPQNPIVLGMLKESFAFASDLTVADGFAYLTVNWYDGLPNNRLLIIDVRNSANPKVVSEVETFGLSQGIWVQGNRAYLTDDGSYEGVVVIDITDPTQPVVIDRIRTPGRASGIAVSGDVAYVADGLALLEVVDITENPEK